MDDQQQDTDIMGMPWLAVLALVLLAIPVFVLLAMAVMFISMGVGMAHGETAGTIALISCFAFIALAVAGVRWVLKSQKDKP